MGADNSIQVQCRATVENCHFTSNIEEDGPDVAVACLEWTANSSIMLMLSSLVVYLQVLQS